MSGTTHPLGPKQEGKKYISSSCRKPKELEGDHQRWGPKGQGGLQEKKREWGNGPFSSFVMWCELEIE